MRRALFSLLVLLVCLGGLVVVGLRSPSVQDRMIDYMARSAIRGGAGDLFADDALRVLVCGSGSPLPSRERKGPCVTVFAGGKFYVVDVGPRSWENMGLWRVPGEKIGAVFLTHFHSDHIGDLGELNLQTWVAGRPTALRVFGPEGVQRVVGGFNEAFALDFVYRSAHHGADFMPIARGQFEAHPFAVGNPGVKSATVLEENGLRVTAFSVTHEPIHPAVGYRFDYKGRSVVISGDTIPDGNLIEVARQADVLLHEAQANFMVDITRKAMLDLGVDRIAKVFGDIPSYHTTPVQAAEIANKAGVQLLVLYHLTPAPPSGIAETIFMRGVADVRSHGVELSRDGLIVELPYESKDITTRYIE